MILLTGVTGNTGGQVAAQLTNKGVPFRVMARSKSAEEKLKNLGYQTVFGDFEDPTSLRAVLSQGITRAYLVCTPDDRMIWRECNFVEAARVSGVKHVVKLSAFSAGLSAPSINLRAHGEIEKRLMESGMQWTIVRPHGFMQTFVLISLEFVKAAGLYMHSAGDGAMPLVDVRDVAAVGVKALTEDGHHGKEYDVTGPESLTYKEQADILAAAFGRPVTYVNGSEGGLLIAMKMMGVATQSIEHVKVIMRLCREHKLADKTDTLQKLGITPTTFASFANDLVAGRTGGGNSFQPPSGALITAMTQATIYGYRAKFALFGRD